MIVYAAGANNDVAPIRTVTGSHTGLSGPDGIALDVDGKTYVAISGSNSVTVYAAGANGNALPTRTISGSKTGLSIPAGVALDGNGNVYVADPTTNNTVYAVTVYAAGASGNVAPIRTISGSKTGLNTPVGVALDSGGNIYALNHNPPESVRVYAVSANGNVSPIRAISGSNTGLNSPAGIAVHSTCSK